MSTFNVGLTGLNAASKDLAVTGNNIANVGTVGFKRSRAEFGDLFNYSCGGSTGNGVRVLDVAQQHSCGPIELTDNPLDLAIDGNGFFTMQNPDGGIYYTRNGEFKVDRDGNIVNSQGQFLQGYAPLDANDPNTAFATGALGNISFGDCNSPPNATTEIELCVNLPADAELLAEADEFFPEGAAPDPDTYNHATAVTVYDSLGTPRTLNMYFVKSTEDNADGDPPVWRVYMGMEVEDADGNIVMQSAYGGDDPADPQQEDGFATLTFTPEGFIELDPEADPPSGIFGFAAPEGSPDDPFLNGANALFGSIDFGATSAANAGQGSTQYGTQFNVNTLTQDGYTTGNLSGIEVDGSGRVFGVYTNGQSNAIGQVAMAKFTNPQGLQPVGNNNWMGSFAAGDPVYGAAGAGGLGNIQSSALEGSNVDLTEELVNLITAQRNFEANSKTISTSDQLTQTVINLVR
jgi:flagellar hook protein FlgE